MNKKCKVAAYMLQAMLLIGLCSKDVIAKNTANKLVDLESFTVPTAIEQQLTFVTWNVEHLAYPTTAGCKPRTDQELAQLQDYAKSLNADVVGLQEVASEEAVSLLFPTSDWQIFISDRPDSEVYSCRESGFKSSQQKVAYAVRKGINVTSVTTLNAFGLESTGLRHGLELQIASPHGVISVLNLHLKSGCFVDDYTRSDSEACVAMAQQAPILDKWIETKESQRQRYVILGDFNHRLSAPYNSLTRLITKNSNGTKSSLVNTTASIIGCHPYYPAPIDHILMGNWDPLIYQYDVTVHKFKDMQVDNMLSDHCAISLNVNHSLNTLSNGVTWFTTSKEYQYLTTKIYQDAEQTLVEIMPRKGDWVVAMDVDETILDNSLYQVVTESAGVGYTPETWATWVANEKATLVPGVASFIAKVFANGGRLALITNRDRGQDKHTWNNLLATGLPVTVNNTCLIGRAKKDKDAINHSTIINDKDLRRQQVQQGTASCYAPSGSRAHSLPASDIIMQVGDNIEDLTGVTQEDADVKSIQTKYKGSFVLLPNPIYGSW